MRWHVQRKAQSGRSARMELFEMDDGTLIANIDHDNNKANSQPFQSRTWLVACSISVRRLFLHILVRPHENQNSPPKSTRWLRQLYQSKQLSTTLPPHVVLILSVHRMTEDELHESIAARTEVLASLRELGPPDLVQLIKQAPRNPGKPQVCLYLRRSAEACADDL